MGINHTKKRTDQSMWGSNPHTASVYPVTKVLWEPRGRVFSFWEELQLLLGIRKSFRRTTGNGPVPFQE